MQNAFSARERRSREQIWSAARWRQLESARYEEHISGIIFLGIWKFHRRNVRPTGIYWDFKNEFLPAKDEILALQDEVTEFYGYVIVQFHCPFECYMQSKERTIRGKAFICSDSFFFLVSFEYYLNSMSCRLYRLIKGCLVQSMK